MDILLTGSVAYDYLMTFPGLFKEQILPERLASISLSFLVESMSKQRGGIAPNIAYTMTLLGEKPRVMATVGEDFGDYRAWLDSKGVDTELMKVVPGLFTASFFATTDQASAQIASFYPGAMGHSATQSIKELPKKPDLVTVSPSAPDAMMKFPAECRELGIPYLYDPSQQVLRLEGHELARDMEGAHFLFCNDYEFGLISKKTGWSLDQILGHVKVLVITRGKDGADLYAGGESVHIPTVPEDEIVDPTGVGDAFRGGFLAGYANGFDWKLCGEIGSLSAVYCLEQRGTQNHSYTKQEFIQRFRDHFDDSGRLDALLK
ncbi:MAG TPA: carbohydrate kinase family protein [Anaerolineales bacterium]|nr:carbohydrate kinase family protein [Anaerolineales bacterium]HMX75039.1 carbohydrate kinase family protein [Anaerolineales bacterium]HNA53069.1 carbohydrate kinase family protein [Anaerolineales bacterium]HNC88168.1 carbohydrate kinase family protein [Anaerolineales bacterium]HNE67163.1 carbohydrate kinase family protein [Anaerolineales bacterium]